MYAQVLKLRRIWVRKLTCRQYVVCGVRCVHMPYELDEL